MDVSFLSFPFIGGVYLRLVVATLASLPARLSLLCILSFFLPTTVTLLGEEEKRREQGLSAL